MSAGTPLIGPGIFTLDFSAHKEFRMPYSERHALQFRFEAFNILNHPVWGAPNSKHADRARLAR